MTLTPTAFFSQIPTDQILALAGARCIKRPDAMLLLALFSHKRRPGITEVRPRQERIAALLACSVRTVQRGLDRLAAAGLIVKRYMRDRLGRLHGLRYDLANTLALLPARANPSKATHESPGAAVTESRRLAPAASNAGQKLPPAPKRQMSQPESESDAVEINNTAPKPEPSANSAVVENLIVENLIRAGILPRVASPLAARVGEARCRLALDALAKRRDIHNKPAWLYRCLSEGWDLKPATPSARPQSQHLYTPPAASSSPRMPEGTADPLHALPAPHLACLEAQARAQLIAELPVLRPVLEKGRRTPQILRKMRELLAAFAPGGVGDGAGDLVGGMA